MQPQLPDRGTAQDDPGGRSRWWWWLVVVGAVAVVLLLVIQPWGDHQTEPPPTDAPTSASDVPMGPSPSMASSKGSGSSPAPVTGASAVFDATTAPTLFVTPQELAADVPAAAGGVRAGISSGELAWGLPEGSAVEPEACTTAVTTVARQPDELDARSVLNDAFSWEQQVVVLADATVSREAFSDLVTTVDACPAYARVGPGAARVDWAAEPAIEGQGVYPSIVQEVTRSEGGRALPAYVGHMLVGNTIVTWTATSTAPGADKDAALATLGDPATLAAMVQGRAQQAVEGLG